MFTSLATKDDVIYEGKCILLTNVLKYVTFRNNILLNFAFGTFRI